MKKLFFLGFLLSVCQLSFGQYALREGQAQFNAGLGFSSWGLPVYAGLDYGVHKDISVGGELSFRSYHDRWDGARYSHTIIGIAGNGNYHFNHILDIPNEWDFYAGLNLGVYIWSSSGDYNGSGSTGVGLGAQIGGRYYLNDRVGLNLEFGGGSAFGGGKFGVSIKL